MFTFTLLTERPEAPVIRWLWLVQWLASQKHSHSLCYECTPQTCSYSVITFDWVLLCSVTTKQTTIYSFQFPVNDVHGGSGWHSVPTLSRVALLVPSFSLSFSIRPFYFHLVHQFHSHCYDHTQFTKSSNIYFMHFPNIYKNVPMINAG